MSVIRLSGASELAAAYALGLLGENEDESPVMRRMAADALREMGHNEAAMRVEAAIRDHSVQV